MANEFGNKKKTKPVTKKPRNDKSVGEDTQKKKIRKMVKSMP